MKKKCIPYPILEPVVDMGCDTDLAIHYSLQIFLLFINKTKKTNLIILQTLSMKIKRTINHVSIH